MDSLISGTDWLQARRHTWSRRAALLEHHLADLADIEFTIDDGRLWMLQVRVGKRSPRAALEPERVSVPTRRSVPASSTPTSNGSSFQTSLR